MKVLRPHIRLPKKAVNAPLLATFKARLKRA